MKQKEEKIRISKPEGYYKWPISEIHFHNVQATRTHCGVYKIMFGEKYYIGQSIHIGKRAKMHLKDINKIMNEGLNSGKRANIINHLKANNNISNIHVFILELCLESELQSVEQKWLTKSKNDVNCLNSNFISYTTPFVAAANKFKPVEINSKLTLDNQRELNLYNTFISELNSIKANPRVKLKKWFS